MALSIGGYGIQVFAMPSGRTFAGTETPIITFDQDESEAFTGNIKKGFNIKLANFKETFDVSDFIADYASASDATIVEKNYVNGTKDKVVTGSPTTVVLVAYLGTAVDGANTRRHVIVTEAVLSGATGDFTVSGTDATAPAIEFTSLQSAAAITLHADIFETDYVDKTDTSGTAPKKLTLSVPASSYGLDMWPKKGTL